MSFGKRLMSCKTAHSSSIADLGQLSSETCETCRPRYRILLSVIEAKSGALIHTRWLATHRLGHGDLKLIPARTCPLELWSDCSRMAESWLRPEARKSERACMPS